MCCSVSEQVHMQAYTKAVETFIGVYLWNFWLGGTLNLVFHVGKDRMTREGVFLSV